MVDESGSLTGQATELLQQLIRNRCVNDGSVESGHEVRNATLIQDFLHGSGVDMQCYEPAPGRVTLVAKLTGSDPTAPKLTWLGHTDVVPATSDAWRHDPFGGELIDGEIWGRGAIDMLNLTATMAVALRQLGDQGFRPHGDLTYIAVADEEALSRYGARWMTTNAADDIASDFVITESGGFPMVGADGATRLPVIVGEKGVYWCTLTVTGVPGHGSQPLRTDNALVKAAQLVRRIDDYRPQAEMHEAWRRFINGMGFPPEFSEPLLDPDRIGPFCDELPFLGLARQAHACTHTTMAPTIIHGGSKINIIPDQVSLELDIRTLPGWQFSDVQSMLDEVIGDLADCVSVEFNFADTASISPIDTPLWDSLQRVTDQFYPGARHVPFLTVGATDARFHRELGAVAYGFGLHSRKVGFEDYATMFHGIDERVDTESLRLSTEMWLALARDFLV